MDETLLHSKLRKPPLPEGVTRRPHLIERLNAGTGNKLSLVSAPAGYGKSTLLSEWAAQASQPTAWLSLNEEDNDPVRFWMYIVSALRTIPTLEKAGIGGTLVGALQSQQPPALTLVLPHLINEITAVQGRFALILDDLQAVSNPQVQKGLRFFLESLPPGSPGLHVVIASRIDPPWPLARLRAQGELTELRTQDLRFTLQETSQFLRQTAGLKLSPETSAALDARTEGWAAGLQMAAISIRNRSQALGETGVQEFIQSFTGSHRFVLDFLIEEVLEDLPSETHDFLLKTSILKRFQAGLCKAVTQNENSLGVLAGIEKQNLFLVSLDDERRWYRYHPLFADLLEKRLRSMHPEWLPGLHLRASEWHEGEGNIAEAVSHALAIPDYKWAVTVIQKNLAEMFYRGELSLIQSWMDTLPEEVIRSHPDLCAAYAWTQLERSPEQAGKWIEAAEAGTAALSDQDPSPFGVPIKVLVASQAAALRVSLAVARSEPAGEVIELAKNALNLVPETDAPMRGMLALQLGMAYLGIFDEDNAAQAFELARRLGETSGSHYVALSAVYLQADLAWRSGQLEDIARICRAALAEIVEPVERSGIRLPVAAPVYLALGKVLLEWNNLAEAKYALDKGLQLIELLGEPKLVVDAHTAYAELLLASGKVQDLPDLIRLAEERYPDYVDYLTAQQAHLQLRYAEQAPPHLADIPRWANGGELDPRGDFWEVKMQLVRARLRIAQHRSNGKSDLNPVLAYLEAVHQLADQRGWSGLVIETTILQAMALDATGRIDHAVEALGPALSLARPQGYLRIFLEEGLPMEKLLFRAVEQKVMADFAKHILGEFQSEAARNPAEAVSTAEAGVLIEPLSEREVEVLTLMAKGFTNRQIAARLTIATGTVKKHADNIYGKLGVNRRGQATARARDLGILQPENGSQQNLEHRGDS